MSRRVAIPSVEGVQDPKTARILAAMKERIERSGRERVGMVLLGELGPAATTNDIINKINEIVQRMNS